MPRRGSRVERSIARVLFRGTGWSFEGELPDVARAVIVVAPHTSNWDFLLGIAAMFALGVRVSWLGKHTVFRWPLGGLMRWLGGIPIDRSAAGGVVASVVEEFRRGGPLILGLSPEGTRRMVDRWRTGFHTIALAAGVPIVPVRLDYRRRRIRLGTAYEPSGDLERDMTHLREFFRDAEPRRPEGWGGVRW